MSQKVLNSRIVNKHDVEANWKLATNFKPLLGELIIYDPDDNYSYSRYKIGDGNTLVSNLPFLFAGQAGIEGKTVTYTDINGVTQTVIINKGAEIFNDYEENVAVGTNSHAEGYWTVATGDGAHAEGSGINCPLMNKQGARSKITNISNDKKTITISPIPTNTKDEVVLKAGHKIRFDFANGTNTARYKVVSFNQTTGVIVLEKAVSENISVGLTLTKLDLNYALGDGSHVEGGGNIASGDASHAEGGSNIASGEQSHAEGVNGFSEGLASHSEGYQTISSNTGSHSEGYTTTASAMAAHAEGGVTTAKGMASHAEGVNTIAAAEAQHVQGKFNIEDATSAHIVGNGKSGARSNAHTLDWDGNAWFAGDVYVGSTSGTNKDAGSKKLATEEYSMPKYNEGILTYQDDPELEGKTYCVDIPDFPEEPKIGMELTIIPHVTSVITGPSLSINGSEKVGMRVTASTTNSSFNGTRPDFMNAGTPVKLMYMERRTQANPAYTILPNDQRIDMKEAGTWANGYYINVIGAGGSDENGLVFELYTAEGDYVEGFNNNLDEAYAEEGLLSFTLNNPSSINWVVGTYYFSNGTDETTTNLWRILNSTRTNAEALMSNNAEGGGMYPCTPGKANEKLVWNTPAKVGVDINKNSVLTASSTDGVAYTATLDGVTKLYNGLQITILPNMTSTSKSATLDLNGLGAKPIRLAAHASGGAFYAYTDGFLAKNRPVILMYEAVGGRWITVNINRTVAESISGTVAITNGGTGASTASAARTALSVPSLSQFNALVKRVEALEEALNNMA